MASDCDLYGALVLPGGEISCGQNGLEAGEHRLTIRVTGKNPWANWLQLGDGLFSADPVEVLRLNSTVGCLVHLGAKLAGGVQRINRDLEANFIQHQQFGAVVNLDPNTAPGM